MAYKAVFHVDMPEDRRVNIARANIGNFLQAVPQAQAVLLFNGPGAALCRADHDTAAVLAELIELGARVCVCNNALKAFEIPADEVVPGVEVVPAGVVELVDLQNDGWAYIKP